MIETLIASAGVGLITLAGSELFASRRSRRERQDEAKQVLLDRLNELGAALDALILELEQLPRTRRQAVRRWRRIERAFPALDFIVARLARVLFGKELYAAISRLQDATNALLPIAPGEVLAALEPIFDRFQGYEDRGANWFEQLKAERGELFVAARQVASDAISPATLAPLEVPLEVPGKTTQDKREEEKCQLEGVEGARREARVSRARFSPRSLGDS